MAQIKEGCRRTGGVKRLLARVQPRAAQASLIHVARITCNNRTRAPANKQQQPAPGGRVGTTSFVRAPFCHPNTTLEAPTPRQDPTQAAYPHTNPVLPPNTARRVPIQPCPSSRACMQRYTPQVSSRCGRRRRRHCAALRQIRTAQTGTCAPMDGRACNQVPRKRRWRATHAGRNRVPQCAEAPDCG